MPAPFAMTLACAQWNLIAAWLGILLGFVSGMMLGMFFHDEKWLGGYASHKRRLYRLGHISFFGLGAVNLFFWLTVKSFSAPGPNWGLASGLFVLGAATMPLCCVVMAHWPRLHLLFAVPVISLIVAAVLTLVAICGEGSPGSLTHQLSTLTQP
jgi:hypothetical protein